jgi:hypothetical protein
MKKQNSAPGTEKRRRRRGHKRRAPVETRAYYTRAEVCARYGLSDKRLAEAMDRDKDLPVIRNGRNLLFPKVAFDAWYEAAASKRWNVHAA